jgi:hypothetical protein
MTATPTRLTRCAARVCSANSSPWVSSTPSDLGRTRHPDAASPQSRRRDGHRRQRRPHPRRRFRPRCRLVPARRAARGQGPRRSAHPIGKKLHALARRMLERQGDYLRFAHDPRRCPFDNNAAERERMVKVRQKISGAMRTVTGAEHFCHLHFYLATAGKHGMNLLDALIQLASGHPRLPTVA